MLTRSLLMTIIAVYSVFAITSCEKPVEPKPVVVEETTFSSSTFTTEFDDATGASVEVTVEQVEIRDFGNGTGDVTLNKNKVYLLDGLVYVNEGQTLTIEAGTVIKGKSGQGETASALIVARGGTILAEGTAADPIIMTSAADDAVRGTDGRFWSTNNLSVTTRGLWGGLIVLGKASLNSSPGESAVEGIPTSEKRGIYGGSDDTDNSGTIKYVSIRHGGTDIGSGNEINGLTLGGVGSGTTVEYVEVIANKDDGFEWFGGTCNTKHLVSAFNGDDGFDYDEGWRGLNQYWFLYQDASADRGGEHDGGTEPETGTPYATPVIYNVTFRGNLDNRALTFRDNAGGEYHNSIFYAYSKGVDIEKLSSAQDSYKQFQDGNLKFTNNYISAPNDLFVIKGGDAADQTAADTYFTDNGNSTEDPMMVDYIPTAAGATSGAPTASDAFFDAATYKGAFEPSATKWIDGWTRLASEL